MRSFATIAALLSLMGCGLDRSIPSSSASSGAGLGGSGLGGAGLGGAGASASGGGALGGAGLGGGGVGATGGTPDVDGGAGAGGAPPGEVCGDGTLDADEACDDGNTTGGDGCSALCALEPGYACDGTVCELVPVVAVKLDDLGEELDDDGYDGSLGSMACVPVFIDTPHDEVLSVVVSVGLDHSFVGDLVIKVVSPTGAVATVLNRPGRAEGVDDGNGGGGDSSNATRSSPLTFDASASDPAESMGNTLEWYDEVCEDDGRCVYAPSPDSAADAGLAGLVGVAPAGEWRVCVGDAGSLDDGTLEQVGLEVHAW